MGGVVPNSTYLTLRSHSFITTHARQFTVPCGDNPPQIVAGYGKWGVIDRPLRQGVTVPLGFDPARLKVEVRFGVWDGRFGFDGWDTSDAAGQAVEVDVDSLHWMAGGNFEAGPSPAVYIDAFDSRRPGARSHLVPQQYWGVAWVIDGGVEWNASLRNANGYRVYQDATFTLLGFLGIGVKPPRVSSTLHGGFFRTTPNVRTALAIAGDPTSHSPGPFHEILAGRIVNHPRNNPCANSRVRLGRKSVRWQMPTGLQVWVPVHLA